MNQKEVVLDTNIIAHAARPPKPSPRAKRVAFQGDPILILIKNQSIVVALDKDKGLFSEWAKTIGSDNAQVLLVRWADAKGVKYVHSSMLPSSTLKRLRQLGFRDTVDKLILRIAIALTNPRVVSDDCDFWNPKDTQSIGDYTAPVVALCRTELNIQIMTFADLLALGRGASSQR